MTQDLSLKLFKNNTCDLLIDDINIDDVSTTITSFSKPNIINVSDSSKIGNIGDYKNIYFIGDDLPDNIKQYFYYEVFISSLTKVQFLDIIVDDLDLSVNPHKMITSSLDLKIIEDNNQINQKIIQRLNVLKGEWFFDGSLGLPWRDITESRGLTTSQKYENLDIYILWLITQTDGVVSVNEYDSKFDKNNRTVSISYSVYTIYNNIETNTFLLGF